MKSCHVQLGQPFALDSALGVFASLSAVREFGEKRRPAPAKPLHLLRALMIVCMREKWIKVNEKKHRELRAKSLVCVTPLRENRARFPRRRREKKPKFPGPESRRSSRKSTSQSSAREPGELLAALFADERDTFLSRSEFLFLEELSESQNLPPNLRLANSPAPRPEFPPLRSFVRSSHRFGQRRRERPLKEP